MSPSGKTDSIVLQLSREHGVMFDGARRLWQLIEADDHEKLLPELTAFLQSTGENIASHFEVEEKVFFPAALLAFSSYEMARLVLRLQKEHGVLTIGLCRLIRMTEGEILEGGRLSDISLAAVSNFLAELVAHAERETETLFPMLEQNDTGKRLIKEYILESYRSGI